MDLIVQADSGESLRAGYQCPCGCSPSVEYVRGAQPATDNCCCGNQFAIGPHAATMLAPTAGFKPELRVFDTPWGDRLEAAWLVGPSVHGPAPENDADHRGQSDGDSDAPARPTATDPVCAMSVDSEQAEAHGLRSVQFDDDPQRCLEPTGHRCEGCLDRKGGSHGS